MAPVFGATPEAIDSLPEMMLMSLPEATIITIVETYSLLKYQGLPEGDILEAIEAHRSMIGVGEMPDPLFLSTYVKYRVALEYRDTAPISEKHIDACIQEALLFFAR